MKHRPIQQAGFSYLELLAATSLGILLFGALMWIMINLRDLVELSVYTSQTLHEARLLERLLGQGAYPRQTVTAPAVNNWIPGIQDSTSTVLTDNQLVTLLSNDGQNIQVGSDSYLRIQERQLYLMKGGANPAVTATPRFASSRFDTVIRCRSTGDPHPDCSGTGELTVNGMVENLSLKNWGANNPYLGTAFILRHPAFFNTPFAAAPDRTGLTFLTGLTTFSPGSLTNVRISPSRTGQTVSYAAGDDGDLEKGVHWPIPRFVDMLNGTVKDNLTGLIWLKNANCFGDGNWLFALNAVSELNAGTGSCSGYVAGTYNDWRLPNVNELRSLIHYGNYSPALPAHLFVNLRDPYWTSNEGPAPGPNAWWIDISSGYLDNRDINAGNYAVWPVRGQSYNVLAPVPKTGRNQSYASGDDGDLQIGISWPNPRFIDNMNGTVTDNLTRLVWFKNSTCFGLQTWPNALATVTSLNSGIATCNGYAAGTHTDWRLPNIREISSLLSQGYDAPAILTGHPFLGLSSSDFFWSSTTYSGNNSRAFSAWTGNGNNHIDPKTEARNVWPVRGGE